MHFNTSIIDKKKFNRLVLLSVVGEDEVLELNLDLDPLLVSERRPDVVLLSDRRLVWLEHHLGAVIVDVECPKNKDEPGEGGV